MRTFIALALLAGAAFWTGWRTPRANLPWRTLRFALFVTGGIFAVLLVSALLQALFGVE